VKRVDPEFVIASEAKQSGAKKKVWIASALTRLAMTATANPRQSPTPSCRARETP
jgi:hypothetical protein